MRRSLTRTERLRASRDIRELFTRAAKIDARGLRLLTRGNGGRVTRFGVVVARGTGSAVRRNREKRLTREAYRALKESVPPGRDVLFYVTRFGMSFEERRAMMAGLLERAFSRGRPGGSTNQ
jgi:ribonuclease P protein component